MVPIDSLEMELVQQRGTVRFCGHELNLCPRALQLLRVMVDSHGETLSREDIVALVWGRESEIDVRTVDVWIMRLRKAIIRGNSPNPIQSVRGTGYRFNEAYPKELKLWRAQCRAKKRICRTNVGMDQSG